MSRPAEWKAMHVELLTRDGHELADACEALNAAGWMPMFVVPIDVLHFQVVASRARKSVNPPPLPPASRLSHAELSGPPRVPPGPPRPKKPM